MRKSSADDATADDPRTPGVNEEPLAPIDITMKLDSLENPVKPPIVIYKHTNHWDKLKMGLEPADQQIVDRLRKLKDEERNVSLPTVGQIQQRLALLKDQNPEAGGSNVINIHQVDTRTDQEKVDDLIRQYAAEAQMEADDLSENESLEAEMDGEDYLSGARGPSTSDVCKDIEKRLSSLQENGSKTRFDRGMNVDKEKCDTTSSDNMDLINKISAMEIETPPTIEDEDEDEDENECVLCSRTANESDLYRCTGCTSDLYCPSCFESSHEESEMMDQHKAVRFIKEDKDNLSSAKMSLIRKLLTSDKKSSH
ncbi:PREDICTED: abscission/NoCut checkpoint regulator isoform X2 [Wasmannia auropunctata]|nr:PREDICTED: abscission/NoCut checkpoint regulator isoform X2 [Wasmannia auropunctata]